MCRRQRYRGCEARVEQFRRTTTGRPLIIVDSHIALRRPAQTGHQRRPQRAARRGGSPSHQAILRLAGGFAVSGARWRLRAFCRRHRRTRAGATRRWIKIFAEITRPNFPTAARERAHAAGELPRTGTPDLPEFPADAKGLATRESSGEGPNAIAEHFPWLIGGAADLVASTKTR